MRFRKLRIAWSVVWGLAAVLLIVLWVRSYSQLLILKKRSGLQAFQISSVQGRIAFAHLGPQVSIGRSYFHVVGSNSSDWTKEGVLGFAYHNYGVATGLIAPLWFPTLLSALLAVIPWASQSWRFSLRTLLIATMLVAVALWLVVYAARK